MLYYTVMLFTSVLHATCGIDIKKFQPVNVDVDGYLYIKVIAQMNGVGNRITAVNENSITIELKTSDSSHICDELIKLMADALEVKQDLVLIFLDSSSGRKVLQVKEPSLTIETVLAKINDSIKKTSTIS